MSAEIEQNQNYRTARIRTTSGPSPVDVHQAKEIDPTGTKIVIGYARVGCPSRGSMNSAEAAELAQALSEAAKIARKWNNLAGSKDWSEK